MMVRGNKLIVSLQVILFAKLVYAECNFTSLSSGQQVMWVPTKLSYSSAKSNCEGCDSNLVEIWNEQEWIEVRIEIENVIICMQPQRCQLD